MTQNKWRAVEDEWVMEMAALTQQSKSLPEKSVWEERCKFKSAAVLRGKWRHT